MAKRRRPLRAEKAKMGSLQNLTDSPAAPMMANVVVLV